MESNPERHRRVCLVGVALLIVLSLAKFVHDVRWLTFPVNDLTTPWVASKAFVAGKNPYNDIQEFERIWAATRVSSTTGGVDYKRILELYPMGYLPSAFPLVAALTPMPWREAVYVYLAGSISLFVAMLLMLARKLEMPWSDLRKMYMMAFALAMAPLHSGIHQSNLNTLTIALLGMGVVFLPRRPYLSGIALALGFCMKPQVAFLFFAYPWLRRKWKTALTGLVACAAISSSSLLWMHFHHIEWFGAYRESVTKFSLPGGANDFYGPGSGKFEMVNLQVLVFQFTHSQNASAVVSWAAFLLLAMVSAFLISARLSEKNEGLGVAIISVLTLFPVYQRIYTAALFIFVLYWAVDNWRLRSAKAALLLMLPLLLPLVAMTQVGALRGFVERHDLDSHFLWNAVVMPHAIWIELFLVAILLAVLYRAPSIRRTTSTATLQVDLDGGG
jgi:hypothetical protein